MSLGEVLGTVFDKVIEGPVVTSFTNIGYQVRSRLPGWDDLSQSSLAGRTVVITGSTSGIGHATAESLARLGANVVVTGRQRDSANAVAAVMNKSLPAGAGSVSAAGADMGDFDMVRSFADELLTKHASIDVLIHNAGALTAKRHTNADGIEATVASQVFGPFLLTSMLLEALSNGTSNDPGRVLTMSSGGMYSEGLTVDELEMSPNDYNGTKQYARAKRAQVTLNQIWAEQVSASDVVFHTMHPGWVDTPGVQASLPTFHKVVGPFLRSPDQGADTMVWLASDDEPALCSGEFWLDRTRRSIHKLPTTKRADTPELRKQLWDRCVEVTGAVVT